jgi:hypothetical protein
MEQRGTALFLDKVTRWNDFTLKDPDIDAGWYDFMTSNAALH